MGCDIHAIVEVKQNGKWEVLPAPVEIPRYYPLFALLAGVRNTYGFTPMSAPRGIPEDASEATKEAVAAFGEAAHSASYFTSWDFLDEYWMRKENGTPRWKLAGSFFLDLLPAIWDLGKKHGDDNVRLVFFFDN